MVMAGALAVLPGVVRASAQTAALPGGTNWGASLYGGSEESRLQLAGKQTTANVLLMNASSETGYDDNVTNGAGPKEGDVISNLGGHVQLAYENAGLAASVDYQPSMQLYRRFSSFDNFDQQFSGTIAAALSDRVYLRAHEVIADQRAASGNFGAAANVPGGLNEALVLPFVPEVETSTRVDVGFVKDARTNVAVFGAYERRHFNGVDAGAANLLNTQGITAGVQGMWRATEHGQAELLFSSQMLQSDAASAGNASSTLPIESLFGSVTWHLGPALTVSGFAGPQYLGGQATTSASSPKRLMWAGGGVVTRQAGRSSWFATGERMVSDGGGLLSYVMSWSASAGVHRLLWARWDGSLQFEVSGNSGLGAGETTSSFSTNGIFCMLQRTLGNVTTHMSYAYVQQKNAGNLPVAPISRNQLGFGLAYQLKAIALGR